MASTTLLQSLATIVKGLDELPGLTEAVPYRDKAKLIRGQLVQLRDLLPGETISISTLEHYRALKLATEALLEKLRDDDVEYTQPEKDEIANRTRPFKDAVTRLQDIEIGFGQAGTPAPMLSDIGRWIVGALALAMFIAGAVCAAIGKSRGNDGLTTLATWLGFGVVLLGGIWLVSYFATRRSGGRSRSDDGPSSSEIQYFVFGSMAFLVMGMLFMGVMHGNLASILGEISTARGVITFLVAVGTIAIAIILTLASVTMSANNNTEELKERLAKGKEILTVLVGVLGTIVGFYFANNPGDGNRQMTVEFIQPAEKGIIFTGSETEVLAFSAGGEMPYQPAAVVTIKDNAGKDVTNVKSTNSVSPQGVVTITLTPDADAAEGKIKVSVEVKDHSNRVGKQERIFELTKSGAAVAADVAPPPPPK